MQDVAFTFLTSHLESTKDYSDERKRQLSLAFKEMLKEEADRTVIFAGDLNLRDKEVSCGGAGVKSKFWYRLLLFS